MVCLAGALDLGSSWREELRRHHGKGAWQTAARYIHRVKGHLR